MTGIQRIKTGVSDQIGRYADAITYPASARVVMTAGTPGLRSDGTMPETFEEEATQAPGPTSSPRSPRLAPPRTTS